MRRHLWLAAAIGYLLAGRAYAAGGEAFTDPAEAGADFAIQGEYQGELKMPDSDETLKVGGQVIALGDGKFHGVFFMGGLPGDGWERGGPQLEADGETADGKVTFAGDTGSAVVEDGKMKILDPGGNELATLKKVERKSPTLGAKPPEGGKTLFDGTSADAWKGGRLVEEKLLGVGTVSKDEFGDFSAHLEFRTPYMPKASGQGRGNSGVYLQDRYEVQVLDSFGLEGADNECGGIYKIKEPAVNMCFPPLSWQTYDIDYRAAGYEGGKKVKNATITVKHNGQVIHQKVELPRATRAAPVAEGPEPGPVYLQDHGNPVRYRNIWIVAK
jgi:hypothetical protein